VTGTGVPIGPRKNGRFPSPCLWPLCIKSQSSKPRQNHLAPPVFVFSQALDPPLLMAMRRHWMKPGMPTRALLVDGEPTETTSPMPLILLAGIAISVIQPVVLLWTMPTTSISPFMRDTTASDEEPMPRKNGCKEWHGKFKAAPSIIRASWLPAKTNSKDHDRVASGHSNLRSQEQKSTSFRARDMVKLKQAALRLRSGQD